MANCPKCNEEMQHQTFGHGELWECPCGWRKQTKLVSKCCGSTWSSLDGARLPLITCDICGFFTEVRVEEHVNDPEEQAFINVKAKFTENKARNLHG